MGKSNLSEQGTEGIQKNQNQSRRLRLYTLILFMMAIGGLLWLARANGVTSLMVANHLINLAGSRVYGPLLYVIAYAIFPILLFPASLLTLASGLLFGSVGGFFYTILGNALSAILGYGLGRWYLDASSTDQSKWKVIEPYIEQMQANPFPTVLTIRILYLPHNLVNYSAGALRLPWISFLAATILGSLPSTVALVLAGASIQGSTITEVPSLNWMPLVASGVILASTLFFSRYLRQRQ